MDTTALPDTANIQIVGSKKQLLLPVHGTSCQQLASKHNTLSMPSTTPYRGGSFIPLTCTPKSLPAHQQVAAAQKAIEINPLNHSSAHRLVSILPGFIPTPESIAVVTARYWGSVQGVRLTVGFLDSPEAALRTRILQHMNAWAAPSAIGATANVRFVETAGTAQVRIARAIPDEANGVEGGYWSYLGTDILSIPLDKPTMNLQEFTMSTPESEYHRVVRHETGHTMGFPHEHMRADLVAKIDPAKAIAYFGRTQGWSPDMVKAQVLTPLNEHDLLGTPMSDPNSIMCYQIPGEITVDGQPIVGGLDIDLVDYTFAQTIYPGLPQSSVKTGDVLVDAEGESTTLLEFSGGELKRIILRRHASAS